MATHRYIVSAGHRNTDRGGAVREIDWTYPISVKLKAAIQRRGGKAWIIQEEDGDSDPTFCVGRGLQAAARLTVDLARAVGGVDAYISMHYEGGPARGFFGIFPDGAGDTRAMNPLDERLCAVIAKHVEKTGMPKRTAGVVQPGVMSERQTGVGAQGWRLGEFVGTIGYRETTARVILEGGNYVNLTDRALLWDPAWQNRYVEAIVDGLAEVFGAFPVTKPEQPPVGVFKVGDRVKATDRLNVRRGYATTHPVVTTLDVGDTAVVGADRDGRFFVENEGRTWLNISYGTGSGWAASEWLEKVAGTTPVDTRKDVVMRFDLPLRDAIGWSGKILTTLKAGEKGKIISGPEASGGMNWYKVEIGGRTGYVPQGILWAIGIEG